MAGGMKRRRSADRDADAILCAVLAEIEAFAELDELVAHGPDPGALAMRTVGVPYRPAMWFSEPLTAARRKAYSRATERLEWAGLVRRVPGGEGRRVSRVQLTAWGLRRALELAGPGADREAVAEGLCRTAWGGHLAEVVRD
jgi:hypothetical protein